MLFFFHNRRRQNSHHLSSFWGTAPISPLFFMIMVLNFLALTTPARSRVASVLAFHPSLSSAFRQQKHKQHPINHRSSKQWQQKFAAISTNSGKLLTIPSPCSKSTTMNRFSDSSNRGVTMTSLFSSTSAPASATLVAGMVWLQDIVVDILNELYDPKEVAKASALAKLEPKKKKKKKKKKKQNNDNSAENEETPPEPALSEEEKQEIVNAAVAAAPPCFTRSDAAVTPATQSSFGDYQVNAALQFAGKLGVQPRVVAQEILEKLTPRISEYCETPPEIAGPGFLNVRWKESYLTGAVQAMAADAFTNNDGGRLNLPTTPQKQTIVVDFSSPNIAKEMHVGHLRSTVIGDCLSSVLDWAGHDVVRLNHVGDWGTQFGMLVEHLRTEYPEALDPATPVEQIDLGDLVTLYKAAKVRFDKDDEFKQRAREGVVKLQAGDPSFLAAWKALCQASRTEYQTIYDLLSIRGLQERGESFYNPMLSDVVRDLEDKGMAVDSEGAKAVFLPGYTNAENEPLPMLVRKSDGGFNYATTDLAAVRHRTLLKKEEEGGEEADRVLYVTDAGQSQHFEMVFAAAKLAEFCPPTSSLEHVPFGLVQGEDGKKLATRSGETVKLKDLLNEAVRRAGHDLKERRSERDGDNTEEEAAFLKRVDNVAQIVGIGAVKYADLSLNRESNYRFSYDRMLSLNGNTAPYMLYAYARICGIVRKATTTGSSSEGDKVHWPEAAPLIVSHPTELELMRNLIKLPDVLAEVERDLYPNRLCDYLFETSQQFNQFYENCSVNKAETPELKASRLTLCTATAGTIRLLLRLLGIPVVEQM